MGAFIGDHATHGPVWQVTYEEKEVGGATFESEERKVAFVSPGLLVDVENASDSGDGIMQFKEVKVSKTNTTIERLSCHIFMMKSLSLSKPTKFTIFH